ALTRTDPARQSHFQHGTTLGHAHPRIRRADVFVPAEFLVPVTAVPYHRIPKDSPLSPRVRCVPGRQLPTHVHHHQVFGDTFTGSFGVSQFPVQAQLTVVVCTGRQAERAQVWTPCTQSLLHTVQKDAGDTTPA